MQQCIVKWHFNCKENKRAIQDMASEILKTYDVSHNGFLSQQEMRAYYRSLIGDDATSKNSAESIRESFDTWFKQIDLEQDAKVSQMDLACYL